MKIPLLIFAVLFAFTAQAGDKFDTSNFPLTANVVSSSTESVETGATVSKNPACADPQGSFMKGFCAAEEKKISTTYSAFVLVVAEIGDYTYKLKGRDILMPGMYRAKLTKHGVEILGQKSDGRPSITKYRVVSVAAKQPPRVNN